MPTSTEYLARQIETLRTRLDRGLRTPQLTNSAIDNGSLPVKDANGTTTVIIGQQYDGTAGAVTVTEPAPPIPVGPTAVSVPGGINVNWSGNFLDPQAGYTSPVVAPMTFNGVMVEVSTTTSFTGSPNRGMIQTASGGDRSVNWPTGGTTLYVRLRTRGASGILSTPSAYTTVVSGQVQLGDLGFDVRNYVGANTIYYGTTSPTAPSGGFRIGDLWLKNIGTATGPTPPNGTPLYETYRWLGAAWSLLENQGVSQALADALAATNAASAASALATSAQSLAATKITSFYQSAAPTSGMSTGDFWIDTDDKKLYRYNGASWLLSQDADIAAALTDAGTAQATADRKIRIFVQTTAPTAEDVGDLWIDTDDGNKMYTWGNTTTARRQNWIINPSFEYDASGTLASAPTGWTRATGGTVGTVATTIDTSGSVGGTKRAKITGTTLSTLTTAWIGFTQVIPSAPGDVLQIQSWLTYAVTSASQRPEYMVEWLNAAGGVISTLNDTSATTMGTAGTRAPYGYTTTAAPALTASARITVRRRGTLASGGTNVTNADLAVDAMIVERNRAAGYPTGYFDGNTTGSDHIWNGDPYISTSTAWEAATPGTNAWQPQTLRTGSFEPKSVLAANIIATGSITAALLEANMVLATTVIAGNSTGDYAAMRPDGFRVFTADPIDGIPNEVIRMGTDTNDYFGVVDTTGNLVASIDDTGAIHASDATIDSDPLIMGIPFTKWVGAASGAGNGNPMFPGATHWLGWIDSSIGTVTSEIGLTEVLVTVDNTRGYWIGYDVNYIHNAGAEAYFRIRDGGTSSPTITSPEIMKRQFSHGLDFADVSAFAMGIWNPTTSGTHRLLLTAQTQGAGYIIDIHTLTSLPGIIVIDLGPKKPISAQINRGGGGVSPPPAPPAPPQQYYVDLAPAGFNSFRGDGTLRTDVPGPVQGYDPSGFNGDGKGHWWFNLPSITGTVDRVDFYCYSNHWYYNSGGTAIFNITAVGFGGPAYSKQRSDYYVGGYPKPGGKQITLPSDWWPFFRNASSPRVDGITVGASGGTNLTYYGRFDGPSARLRIWYTQ